ncbi:MAG TPA: type II secretion system protein N [Allosphingosinicella sp.]|jgi:general secretion pathway protein C
MRLALDSHRQLLLRRVPRTNVYTLAELGLLSLLAVQCARLVWAFATPLGPVGDWRPAQVQTAQPGTALLGSFDPFFRLTGGGPVVVTSLSLKLFGVRQDEASGRGSAIIALPDGTQRSFAVGDEIMPGVKLEAVAFDNVTIARGGASEQLFMDQSKPAQAAGTTPVPAPVAVPNAPAPAPAQPLPVVTVPTVRVPPPLANQISFQPRLNGSQVTGVTLSPQNGGAAFRAAGLQPGDVLIAVNGQRITSAEQLGALRDQLSGARGASVQVERGGRVTRIQLRNSQ